LLTSLHDRQKGFVSHSLINRSLTLDGAGQEIYLKVQQEAEKLLYDLILSCFC